MRNFLPGLKEHGQVLCIVNTRNHAKKLYDAIKDSGNCYHLSARMCPVHRRKKIAEIKTRLKEGKDCRVISTQLIEAGVDIDFPVVYRTMTGIDSIAQAAGRCNREGKLPIGEVFIFKSTRALREGNLMAEVSLQKLARWLLQDRMIRSRSRLWRITSGGYITTRKTAGLMRRRSCPLEERSGELAFPFEDIADEFQIIEEGTKDLIIPYDENARVEDCRTPGSRISLEICTGTPGIYGQYLSQ